MTYQMVRRILLFLITPLTLAAEEVVVLLHGLAATAETMGQIHSSLENEGYRVINIDYPTTQHSLEELTLPIRDLITDETQPTDRIHFVTHSMGGILVRLIQRDHPLKNIGRTVMISPPNQGSEAVNLFGDLDLVAATFGPAAMSLAAGDNHFLQSLPPADFEVGVIAGSQGIDIVMSSVIPGPDDGVVSVASTRLPGMSDFTIVHASHPLIVFDREAIKQTVAFLKTGEFPPPSFDRRQTPRSRRHTNQRASAR